MLDTLEVTKLEKLYSKKRAKELLKYSLFSLFAIAILAIALFSLRGNNEQIAQNKQETQENKLSQEKNTEKLEQEDEKLALNDKPEQIKQKNKQTKLLKEKARAKIKKEALAPTDLSGYFDEAPENVVSKEPLYRTTIEELDSTPAQIQQKPVISITSQEIAQNPNPKGSVKIKSVALKPSLDSIEEHFKNSKDPKDALALARDYYAKKDYKNAAKWAFELNNLDKNNADGWLIFAKSKYNVGNKKDALKVLEAYLSQANDKEKVTRLISKMQRNTPLSE